MKTAIITSDTSLSHDTGLGHPEKPDRVAAIIKNLKKNKKLIWKKNDAYDQNILNFTHTSNF
jgi:acetoin utilization deacetylase AcuC-like enzyme